MSAERNLPSSALQPLNNRQLGGVLGPLFNLLSYLRRPFRGAGDRDRVFQNNSDVWRAALTGTLRSRVKVWLEGFRLFEWFPRAPGLFHTPQGEFARREALRFVDEELSASPLVVARGQGATSLGPHTLVLRPEGKLSMLHGGVGCVRLKPLQRDGRVLWMMTASSTGVAHEGFPVAVPDELYRERIEEIVRGGSLECTIVGELEFFPDEFGGVFMNFQSAPQLYLEALEVWPRGTRQQATPATEVSVAVSFLSDYERRNGVYASFVTFDPSRASSLDESVGWLKEAYVEGRYRGRILTDFDQTRVHFPEAALSLRKVMGLRLSDGELRETIRLLHAQGDFERLFQGLRPEELHGGRVARTKVFVSYSHQDAHWLGRVRTHLSPLAREGRLDLWDDTRIAPGMQWEEELESAIESAKVAVLLVSANFFASDFIADQELPRILAAAERGELIVLPVLLSSSQYRRHERLNRIQAVNDLNATLDRLSEADQEQVFDDLADAVQRALG